MQFGFKVSYLLHEMIKSDDRGYCRRQPGGISEALIATAAGLAAAIPAVIAFNHFMQKIRNFESELNNFSADFLNIIERDILNDKGSS